MKRPAASQAARRLNKLEKSRGGNRVFHSYYDSVNAKVVLRLRLDEDDDWSITERYSLKDSDKRLNELYEACSELESDEWDDSTASDEWSTGSFSDDSEWES